MSNAAQYYWTFANRHGRFSGYLTAVDPRDAVSRILTQDIAFSAKLFGDEYDVPQDVLLGAPGTTACPLYEDITDDYALRVKRLS
jgi:hypothetical protein